MAGNDQRDGIGAVGGADGAHGGGFADAARKLRIRNGPSARDAPEGGPHLLLERRPVQLDRNPVDRRGLAGKLPLEDPRDLRHRRAVPELARIPAVEHALDGVVIGSEVQQADPPGPFRGRERTDR